MKTIVIILAGGKGSRLSNKIHKQLIKVDNQTLLEHVLKKISLVFKSSELLIVIPKELFKNREIISLNKYTDNEFVSGGNTRKESVRNAIIYINERNIRPDNILIHDGARPNVSIKLLKKIKSLISNNDINFVVPYLLLSDTLKKKSDNNFKTLKRDNLILTQTPQAFKFNKVSRLYFNNNKITDDAQLAEIYGIKKGEYILGDVENIKITNTNDLELYKKIRSGNITFKVGNGFDVHKLGHGTGIYLGGIIIKSKFRLIGHSDGDVVLHALCDSILGTINKDDIGTHFPPSEGKYKHFASTAFLIDTMKLFNQTLGIISNIDITIICQSPNLKNYKNMIKLNIAKLTKINISKINIKAKTTDYLGLIGKSKAISCWVTTTAKF